MVTKFDIFSDPFNTNIVRRPVTRSSGFKSHADATGSEWEQHEVTSYFLPKNNSLTVTFYIIAPEPISNAAIGYGGWFYVDNSSHLKIIKSKNINKSRAINLNDNDWHAFGSLTFTNLTNPLVFSYEFVALDDLNIAIFEPKCGIVEHEHINYAKREYPHQLDNLYRYAPETNFYKLEGNVILESINALPNHSKVIINLKSCNRCARQLPINYPKERHHLSFSNHCVKNAPCTHTGFGRLRNVDNQSELKLYNGFQLECRYCKKFVVNAPLNPQRTAHQMKEDGARRRGFESLLQQLYGESAQLTYRSRNNGRELAEDIWHNFDKKCFNCGVDIPTLNDMHLDHTRPLALLWPLDETATCLCASCNSSKRDRSPRDFYNDVQLEKLSEITGIPLSQLQDTEVNFEAVRKIITCIDWLLTDFCKQENLNQFRDNKNTAELFLNALQKAFNKTPFGKEYRLIELYRQKNSFNN